MSGRGPLGKGRESRIQSSRAEDLFKRLRFFGVFLFFQRLEKHTIKRREEATLKQ